MTAYETTFKDLDDWLKDAPWGTPNGMQGIVHPEGLSFSDQGLVMTCIKVEDKYYRMPRIFWKGAPFSYGLFEAEMTVPKQRAVPFFCLYSQARYKKAVRSILPEIDIAEFSTKNNPDELNLAVHHWQRNPDFQKHWDYKDPEKRHRLDYYNHVHKETQVEWTEERTNYKCEVTKKSIKIYVNGKREFTYCRKLEAVYNPTFGILVPDWIVDPDPKYMIIHSLKIEQ